MDDIILKLKKHQIRQIFVLPNIKYKVKRDSVRYGDIKYKEIIIKVYIGFLNAKRWWDVLIVVRK